MASQGTKVRLVKCPRCFLLLPELANLQVYKCGGCGTILKAKKRKENQEGKISEALAQNSSQKKEPGHDNENEELKCSSRKQTMYSTDTCEQHEHRDCDKEKSGNGYSSSGKLKWREEEGLLSVAGGNSRADGNSERGSDMENTSPDRQEIAGHSKFTSASKKPCDESIPSNRNVSSLFEEIDISEKIIRRYANLIGSRSPVQTPGATGNKIVSEDAMVGNKLRDGLVVSDSLEVKINHAYDDRCTVQTPCATDNKLVSEDNMVGNKIRGGLVVSEPPEAKTNHSYDDRSPVQTPVATDNKIVSDDNIVGNKLSGGLVVSEPLEAKINHSYGDRSPVQTPGATDNKIVSEDNMLGNKLRGGLVVSEPLEAKINHSYDDRSPVQTPGATDNKIVSEDNMVGNKIRGGLVVSEPPEAKISHAYDDRSPVQTLGSTDNKIVSEDNMVGNKLRGGLVVSEPPEAKINHSYDDRSPVQTPGATDNKIVSEDNMVGNKLRGGLVVSELQEAKINHVYDGSVSSNDSWADQVSDLHLHQSKKSYSGPQRVEGVISTDERPTAEDMLAKKINSKIEEQNQSRNFSLIPVTEMHSSVVEGNFSPDRDESTENTRYGFQVQKQENSNDSTSLNPVQSWLGVNEEELKTKKPLGQRDSAVGYENSGPSEYNHHEEFLSSSLYEPKKLESVERNQMELMRKMDELRDQLNKTYSHSMKAKERLPTNGSQQEQRFPLYYDRNRPEQDVLQRCDVTLPRQYPETYRPSKSMPLQPQMPLSGNVVNCRHHTNCPCSKTYNEDWQSLQKLLAPNFYNERLLLAYPGQVCYGLNSSIPSSPVQHLHSRPPLHSRDVCMLPPNQIDRDHYVEKLHHRERRQPVIKRHCRPIAGGAPFIICYSCRKLLYLPADSFHSKKRCHRLQCGSCSKVLMFLLHKRTHIAPYSLNTAVPPPGEIDSSRASTSMRNSTSTWGANNNPRGDPLSYSEDFRLSICKSDFSEGDLPTNSVQAYDSDNPSANKTRLGKLQYEGSVTKTTGPSLHQLMGYSSPSKLLKGSGL